MRFTAKRGLKQYSGHLQDLSFDLRRNACDFAATSSPNESQKTEGTLGTFTFRLLSENASLDFVPGTNAGRGTLLANQNGTLTLPRPVNWTGFRTTPADSAGPSDVIQEVAVGPNSTYFIVSTKPPDRGTGVVHREYKITVHIPSGVKHYIFRIPQPEDKQEAALAAGLELTLGLTVGAAGTVIPVLGPAVTIAGFMKGTLRYLQHRSHFGRGYRIFIDKSG